MFCKIATLLKFLILRVQGKVVFANYYCGEKNVGDLLNIDLFEHYSGKKVVIPPKVKYFKHTLGIGSIIENMNRNTIVFGSGLNLLSNLEKCNELGDIRSVRGELSKEAIEDKFKIDLNVPLGDFGLLFPKIIKANSSGPRFKYGLILHYVDENHSLSKIAKSNGIKLISVRQTPEAFISELNQCDKVLSSSMHGLILADAYRIPNQWIRVSDHIVGGTYKYNDYYSTTDNPSENCIIADKIDNFEELLALYKSCSIKNYIYDINDLEKTLMEYYK